MRIVALAALLAVACSTDREPRETPLAAYARACAKDAEMGCGVPILTVDDLKASQRYFRDKLGFQLQWEDGEPADFASVGRGRLTIFLCQRCQGHPGGWLYSVVKDVDKLHAELKRRGAIIKLPPTDMEWRMREMHVADPDGNTIRFGQPIPRRS